MSCDLKWLDLDDIYENLLYEMDDAEVEVYINKLKNDKRFKNAELVEKYNSLIYLKSDMNDLVKNYPKIAMECISDVYNQRYGEDKMLWGASPTIQEYLDGDIDIKEKEYNGLLLDVEYLISYIFKEEDPLLVDYYIYLLDKNDTLINRLYNSNNFVKELELIKNDFSEEFEEYKINKEKFVKIADDFDNFLCKHTEFYINEYSTYYNNKALILQFSLEPDVLITCNGKWNFKLFSARYKEIKTYNMLNAVDIEEFLMMIKLQLIIL